MDESIIKAYSLELLKNTKAADELKRAFDIVEKVQTSLAAAMDKSDEEQLTKIKIGTILSFSVLKKIISGTAPKDFSKKDWHDIASEVNEYAICVDDKEYTVFVFDLYANYIDSSLVTIQNRISGKSADMISALSAELRDKSLQFKSEEITETAYIENRLWICLDAMIKLLSAILGSKFGTEAEVLTVAVSTFAFEFGRFTLLKQEQELLGCYLERQHQLDDELQAEYDEYIAELNARATKFENLVHDAFSGDIGSRLKNSADLALEAGVCEDDVLKSVDDIDDFFLA